MQRIVVEGISKKFKIGFKKHQSALARFVSIFSGREPKKIIQVLKDVSFSVEAGEIVGIIGENGSGKSTLLRIIAGIYEKDKGRIITNGRIISLMSLWAGLKDRLTMKDNIYLCCTFFGLSQNKIKKKFNSIVEFAELEDFISTKIYQFSAGMKDRLVFSIAIHCNPDIFLLDEAFEVGDEGFKNKGSNKIKELVKKGATVLLVSHDLSLIKRQCNRTILMSNGKILKEGNTESVIKTYLNENDRNKKDKDN